MPSNIFNFKQFAIQQDKCLMKVGTDGVLLGAWAGQKADLFLQKRRNGAIKILDIGTGTGIIAMMMAQKFNSGKADFCIEAIEIEESSSIQAAENIENSVFKGKIKVYHQSLQQYSEIATAKSFDIIVTNPPYFKNSLKSPDDLRNISRHSDYSGISNEVMIKSINKLLTLDGIFFLILPEPEGLIFINEAEQRQLYCNYITFVFPKPGKKCFRILMEFARHKNPLSKKNLVIESALAWEKYSGEYKSLTRDFYINF